MGEISFSYNQAKSNQLLIFKEKQGLGYLSTFFPPIIEPTPVGGLLNLYTYSTYYPTTVSSPGTSGQLASNGDFIYYGAGTNHWIRVSMAEW
jgi:hypothetical protein